jgi:hypothetical protein
MYKVSMEEARWGAVCPDTFLEVAHDSRQVLTVHVIYYLSRTRYCWRTQKEEIQSEGTRKRTSPGGETKDSSRVLIKRCGKG